MPNIGLISQESIETIYSARNIRKIIRDALDRQLDTQLLDWSVAASLAVVEYLEQEYSYASKNIRVQFLRENMFLQDMITGIAGAILQFDTNTVPNYQQVVGWLQAEMPHESVWDRVKCAAELICIGSDKGLYTLKRGSPHVIQRHFHLDQDTYGWINDTQFNPPLVIPPKTITNNKSCGYYTIREPVILGGVLKQHDECQALDVLNILNNMEWEIDLHVLQEPEVPNKPLDTPEKYQNFVQQVKSSQVIYQLMLDHGNKFWFVHQYDTRGRVYQHGYNIHLQSYAWKKALVNLTHEELLTGVP